MNGRLVSKNEFESAAPNRGVGGGGGGGREGRVGIKPLLRFVQSREARVSGEGSGTTSGSRIRKMGMSWSVFHPPPPHHHLPPHPPDTTEGPLVPLAAPHLRVRTAIPNIEAGHPAPPPSCTSVPPV